MTITQKQCLLTYLGYYDGPLDGLRGEKPQRVDKWMDELPGKPGGGTS